MPAPDTSENPLRDASRGQRLQRILADAGVASRRACEALIEAGRVTVNGQVVRTLPAWADPERDHIRVDGRPIEKPEPHLYLMFNKPARTLATPREGPDDARRSVMDMVSHPLSSRLFPAGRLDFDATGLLLLTNDGDLANRLTHARYGIDKTYQMVVRGTLDDAALEHVNKVINQVTRRAARDAGAPRPAQADLTILAREEGRTVLELTARDGRAVLVRDTLAALGHPVKKMERVAIGPVRLRAVAVGHWRELERDELSQLRRAAAGKPVAPRPAPAPTARTQALEGNIAAVKPRRRRAGPPARARQPLIAKRFRGIGQIVEDTTRRNGQAPNPGRGGGRAPRRAPEDRAVPDRRRGRTDAINAYRRKPEPASDTSAKAPRKQAPRADRPARSSKPARQGRPNRAAPAGPRPPRRGGRP